MASGVHPEHPDEEGDEDQGRGAHDIAPEWTTSTSFHGVKAA
jgi:hypothetical protein